MQQVQQKTITGLPARVADLAERILRKNPMHRRALTSAITKLEKQELDQLDGYLDFCFNACRLDADYLCDCYLTIVSDTLREQIYFQEHKKYRHGSFADVANDVYFNGDYMRRYMYGLAVTSFLWPNHHNIMRFFRRTLPRDRKGTYLEIGPGHGFFFKTAMEESSYDEFEGLDISETSVSQTRRIIDFYGTAKGVKAQIVQRDFLEGDIPPASCDAVVMGEVLEHVERPDIFMKRIAEVAKKDAWIFVTTCCNAPAIDHIFLFRSAAEVEKLFADAGLEVTESLILPCEGQPLQKCIDEQLPVNVAYVLIKKQ
jgi:2-polyprenyl-3-methyl-5-hydroxy-6-metoxy-1,4-benzoquinol methylase